MTHFVCSNCGKTLKRGEREMAAYRNGECAECTFHLHGGSRTIEAFNQWLKEEL